MLKNSEATFKEFDRSSLDSLAFDQAKAQSHALGNPKEHQDLQSKETVFDWDYQEYQFQEAAKILEKSGKVEKIVVEEAGCNPMTIYRIGNPNVVIVSHIHGDEPGPAIPMFLQLTEKILKDDPAMKNVLIIPRANEEAYLQKNRGVQLDQELLDRMVEAKRINLTQREEILNTDGSINELLFTKYLTESGSYVSNGEDESGNKTSYIDLNRQFIELEEGATPSPNQLFPKAGQLLKAIKMYAPQAKHGFSFHADNWSTTTQINENGEQVEKQSGCYIYDTPNFFSNNEKMDPKNEKFIQECVLNFQNTMRAQGLPLLNGIDDITDKLLGMNLFVDGYAQLPASEEINKSTKEVVPITKETHNKNFETAIVRWGMDRCWSLETSGWINPDRRTDVNKILLDTIVLPIMESILYNNQPLS
ncbi:hypothetical protein KKI22_01510 [Patescibacteria group bacterium]|nr:hypothetical protein [Patescibacteria group bacterium]